MIGLSGKPLGGGLSPVWPGPGTNGEVLGTTAGDEAADELLSGADDVVSGADDVVSGADELLAGVDGVVSGVDGVVSGVDGLVGGADEELGVPHGPWLRLKVPDQPL
jgi:hypothetical protein